MKRYNKILLPILLLLTLVACRNDKMRLPIDASLYEDDCPIVEMSVDLSLDPAITRVSYNLVSGGIKMEWEGTEILGVYKSKSGGNIRAGKVTATGDLNDKSQTFSGVVSALQGSEKYIYFYPYIQ